MKKLQHILAILVFVIPGLSHSGESTISSNGKALVVYQRVGLASDAYPINQTARAGTLRVVKGVLTISGKATALSPTIVGSIPYIPYTTPLKAQSEWIGTGNSWFPYQYENMLKPAILTYMQAHGYSTAVFDYGQRVLVAATPAPRIKWLSWRVFIDSTGRARYTSAKLLDESPQTLYVSYTPKKVAEGLPAGFAYPDAGKIKWHLMDTSGNAITASTTIDVNGVYDEPSANQDASPPLPAGCAVDPVDGLVSCDSDFGLKCLINNQSDAACPTGQKDVRQLMDEVAPTFAIVDYARKVQPMYDDVDNGDGTFTSVARTLISITKREWKSGKVFFFISPSGGTKFNVEGEFGYELLLQTERYRVENDYSYTSLGAEQSITTSPAQTFAKSVTPPPGATCTSYTFNIIDPFLTNQVYDWRFDTVNLLPDSKYFYVAPLACY